MSRKLPDSWEGDDKGPPFGPFIAFGYGTIIDTLEREAYRRCRIMNMTLPSSLLFPDRPSEALDVVDFREHVIRRSTPGPNKDTAWRHIAELVRTGDEHWLLWALFTAKPKLGSVGYDITNGRPAWVMKIRHTALVVEFGAALLRLDLDKAYVFNRMVDTAQTRATGRKLKTPPPSPPSVSFEELVDLGMEPPSRWGNPHEPDEYQTLQWLVQQINERGPGQISDRQEQLIRRTYLDRDPLKRAAAELGISPPSASKLRKRATNRLARYLNRRDLIEPDEDTGDGASNPAGPRDHDPDTQAPTRGTPPAPQTAGSAPHDRQPTQPAAEQIEAPDQVEPIDYDQDIRDAATDGTGYDDDTAAE
jgi:hypothetical protein